MPDVQRTGMVITHYSETSGAHSAAPCHCRPTNRVIGAPASGKVRTDYNHGDDFKSGTRVLMLKSRHKDGWVGKERAILRQSRDIETFNQYLDELRSIIRPAERIYASASPRNVISGARIFAARMADAMFDPPDVRAEFFNRLQYHWWSSLMQPQTQIRDSKWWMFDCDDTVTLDKVMNFIVSSGIERYTYPTKSGHHVLCRPYDRAGAEGLLPVSPDTNPLMLWSYA